MKELHSSLKVSTNIRMVIIWGLFATVATIVGHPFSYTISILGLVLGTVGGFMQNAAMSEGAEDFVDAESMLDIRAILKGTKWGKRYLYFLWLGNLILVLSIFIFGRGNPLVMIFSGYMSMMFVRELITLKSLVALSKIS